MLFSQKQNEIDTFHSKVVEIFEDGVIPPNFSDWEEKSSVNKYFWRDLMNLFSTNAPLLYSMKTRFSNVFRGYKIGTLVENG